MNIPANALPINELGVIYRQTEQLKLKVGEDEAREIIGYRPAETFEKFLEVNQLTTFDEVIR
jgi:hypothetical protein